MFRHFKRLLSFRLLVILVPGLLWLDPDPANSQELQTITIECVAERKIKEGRELFSRDGQFKGSKIESFLILKNGKEEILVPDVVSPFVDDKKLRFVLARKTVQSQYQIHEVWDSNLKVFPEETPAQLRAALKKRLGNELPMPANDLWVTKNGLQFQLTASNPFAFTNAKAFEYFVWIRNPTKVDKKWKIIAGPRFVPHFQLQVETELGRSMMLGDCRKKHAYQDILIKAGQTKSYRCDLFQSSCDRVRPFHEIPMAYVLDYQGAKLKFFTNIPKTEIPKTEIPKKGSKEFR